MVKIIHRCLEQYQKFSMPIYWLVLYEIFKTNMEPANLTYHTALYHTVPFILHQKAISLLPGLVFYFVHLTMKSSKLLFLLFYRFDRECRADAANQRKQSTRMWL